MNAKAISEKQQNQGCGRFGLAIFGLIFFLAGSLFLYFGFISPMLQSRAARGWLSAPCTILTAQKQVHHGDDSVSYSAEFTYRYQVDGQTYTGDRYSFSSFSGPDSIARKILSQYPVGKQTECYYDPADPSSVVLDRNNANMPIWLGLIPLPFTLVGIGVLAWVLFGSRSSGKDSSVSGEVRLAGGRQVNPLVDASEVAVRRHGAGELSEADQRDIDWSSPRKLQSASSRLGAFILISVFALFWNGFISVFVVAGIMGMEKFQWTSLIFALFLTPFVLVGIGMLVGCVYLFLSLFNPKVEIALSSAAVPLGGDVDIAWEVAGKVERIRKLTIEVRAVQSATYVRGTDTVTDTEVFELIPVVDVTDTGAIAFGSSQVVIPVDSMHTLEADHNKITWSIEVNGEIPWAPDIHESFPFRVSPRSAFSLANDGEST